MKPSFDEPVRQPLKVVTILDCVPGNAENADGPPITILTLAHLDEIEQPLLITLDDTQRLVVHLLVSLASHGDDLAREVLDEHFISSDDDD